MNVDIRSDKSVKITSLQCDDHLYLQYVNNAVVT